VDFGYAFNGCTSLAALPSGLDMSRGDYFNNAWQNCSALTSFPSGAKLGTSASSVNFTDAWRSSGLTSFSTPLPTATNLSNAFLGCSSLESFSTPLPKAEAMGYSWYNCSSLTDFSSDVFTNWNPSSIGSGVFNLTWDGCTSLTAQSVENILTSIDASGHYATTNKVSGGPALADAGIDIDYDGTTLSAATNTAIDSLIGKGWQVYINGVLTIPNVLTLAPAAAYSVKVRRSSDGATSDFKASDVSDGTLTTWVNTDVDLVTPTLNNGGFEDGATGWSLSNATIDTSDFYAGSKSVKLTITGGASSYLLKSGVLQAGASFRVGFWARISDATKELRVEFGGGASSEVITFSSTNWEYKEVTKTAIASGFAFERNSSSGDYTVNIDDITLTQLTADGHVTTWYDQGGTNHASQTFVSNMPKIVDGGTLVTEGGKPAVDFDGTDDALEMGAIGVSGGAARATYAVVSPDRYLTGAGYLGVNSDSGSGIVYDHCIEATQFALRVSGNATYTDTSDKLVQNLWATNFAGTQSNDIELFKNGSQITRTGGVNATLNTTDDWLIASAPRQGNTFYEGTIQEIVIYDSDQSANRTGIEANINDTYTIY
jgi:hypothetical protein